MDLLPRLRAFALALPGVSEELACAGTPLEASSFKVRGKAFLFLGPQKEGVVARFKLGAATRPATEVGVVIGAGGWTKVRLASAPDPALLEDWIRESHALFAR